MKRKNEAVELMLAKAGIEELSQLLQVSLQALTYIAKPAVGRTAKEPATTVAKQALARVKELREGNKQVKEMIRSGEITNMDAASKQPPRVQLADQGEIVFDTKHDLYFHQCCDCGLIHEVETSWDYADDYEGKERLPLLVTKWSRRAGPPTREEMAERGIEVKDV